MLKNLLEKLLGSVWFAELFSMELESVNELEFESNSLPFVFGCVIKNWNLNVIPPPYNHLWVLFRFRVVWVSGP